MKNDQIEFLGYGDVVIDTFIELIHAWIEDDNPEKKQELCMHFGDKIPYKKEVNVKATGNAPNAVNAAGKLGLKTGLVTNVGGDDNGKAILKALEEKGVNTDHITIHPDKDSNHNYILRYKEERTILVHHVEYDYRLPNLKVGPQWMYLSSLAHNSLEHHHEIADFLRDHPETKLAFQPGTFQMKLGYDKLRDLYELTELFFCNKEEAQKILETTEDDIKVLMKKMHDLGPNIVVITDGPRGSYVYDGEVAWHGPMYPDPAPPVDRTGAGDSFSATFTAALAMGRSIEKALMMGPINSMSVVQHIGAQAGHLTLAEIEKFLEEAPADYKPEKI
ncbi:carbohydrate kinase family protein [Candidatus Parcubacteria bacterium]|nr:carbohydrate kinase family protein [Candidatus Parcubacteria bacterium]